MAWGNSSWNHNKHTTHSHFVMLTREGVERGRWHVECFGLLWKLKWFLNISVCKNHTILTSNSIIRHRQWIKLSDGSLAFISWKVSQSCRAFFRAFVDGITLEGGLRASFWQHVYATVPAEKHVCKPSVIYGTKVKSFVLHSFVHVAGISHTFVPWCIHSLSINSLQLRI